MSAYPPLLLASPALASFVCEARGGVRPWVSTYFDGESESEEGCWVGQA